MGLTDLGHAETLPAGAIKLFITGRLMEIIRLLSVI